MSLAGIIYDELMGTGNFDKSEASYYSKSIAKRIEDAGYSLQTVRFNKLGIMHNGMSHLVDDIQKKLEESQNG